MRCPRPNHLREQWGQGGIAGRMGVDQTCLLVDLNLESGRRTDSITQKLCQSGETAVRDLGVMGTH